MSIDVKPYQENGRWHWRIYSPIIEKDMHAGVAGEVAGCCADAGGSCNGFAAQTDAEKAGWAFAKDNGIK